MMPLIEREAGARAAGDQHLFVDAGRGGGDVGHVAQAFEQRTPVANAVALDAHQLDMRGGAEEPVLQVAPHAVGDGESDDERGNAGGDAGDGDGGDHADDGLPPLGFQVARRQKSSNRIRLT